MSFSSVLSHELYHARKELKLTQQDVADKTGISVRWYQQLEKGADMPERTHADAADSDFGHSCRCFPGTAESDRIIRYADGCRIDWFVDYISLVQLDRHGLS